eukprot:jgi/Tetstr1/453933/TSEL_040852.t1
MTNRSLSETLERQLMFPLPRSDEIRPDEDPIIPRSHPIHDYFAAANWRGTVGPQTVNRVIIAPSQLSSAPFAGLFTAFTQETREKLKTAVQENLAGDTSTWQNLMSSDEAEDALKKLERFVRGVAVSYTRDVSGESGFSMNSETEPAGFDVFPAPTVDGAPITMDEAKARQRETSAYTKLKIAHGDTKAEKMFDGMRLYYAYKYLDHVFENPDEYFFITRLLTAAKLLFVAQLFRMVDEPEKFDQVLGWMYQDTVAYASVDPNTNALAQKYDAQGNPLPRTRGERFALDDMFRRNVELSHDVKDMSSELVSTKDRVSGARDNLESLANGDNLVKTQQFNSKVIYFVAIAMLVLQVAGLIAAEYMQSPLMGFLIIVAVTVAVLGVEATNSLGALINL